MSNQHVVSATNQAFDLKAFLTEFKLTIENYLGKALAERPEGKKLWQAMHYSSLNGGKRLRGILCLATLQALKPTEWQKALPLAAGIECIHAMSLVHDDLPCMDNDTLRRGKPTCHVQFDEATALLAGDALLVEGMSLCLQAEFEPKIVLKIAQVLTQAVGAYGMTGGQMIDLENTDRESSLAELELMHKLKTGAFLKASVLSGAIAGGANEKQLFCLEKYAENIGLAFQIVDDLLDLESDSQALGKTAGKDLAQNKTTYPKLLGVDASRHKANQLIEEAQNFLKESAIDFVALSKIADYIIDRKN